MRDLNSLPQVSVAIISYQQRGYIAEAIQSVLDQDYPNLQIVVSDDHSTDGTAELIGQFAADHPDRIVALLHEDRVGITKNFNRALRACTGELVAFLGGDDVLLPGKIQAQVDWFLERPGRVLCGHHVEVFYEDGSKPPHRLQPVLHQGFGAAKLLKYGSFAGCSTMVRADKIPPHGFDEALPLASDLMMWVDVLADGGEFGYVPGTYARYRRHGSNVTRDIHAIVTDVERALELIEKRYPQYAADCRRARARAVHYPIAKHYLDRGNRKAAAAAYVHALKLHPAAPWLWFGLMKAMLPARAYM